MSEQKRDFIIDKLMKPRFINKEGELVLLQEDEESGRSKLEMHLKSTENLCIENVDKKHTELNFFQEDSKESMYKRADHIIFEHVQEDNWNIHIIEMKSSVKAAKWIEIKGKFRASYLLAQGIAAMLDMDIKETYFYTTYENVDLCPAPEQPTARRMRTGVCQVSPQKEWDGKDFRLNLGDRIRFSHSPVQMSRGEDGVLIGSFGAL